MHHRRMILLPQVLLLILFSGASIPSATGHPVVDEEISADSTFLNMSSKGIKTSIDLATLMGNFTEVDLSHNDLMQIQPEDFNVPSLEKIDLSSNPLLQFPETGKFLVSPARILNVSYCNVRTLARDSLAGLHNLEVLDLRGNLISFDDDIELDAPPKQLVLSALSDADLKHLCAHVDLQVVLVDDDLTLECKDVRRNTDAVIVKRPGREKMSSHKLADIELVGESLMISDTHMANEDMLADQPLVEGSGDNEEEITIGGDESAKDAVVNEHANDTSEAASEPPEEAQPEAETENAEEETTQASTEESETEDTKTVDEAARAEEVPLPPLIHEESLGDRTDEQILPVPPPPKETLQRSFVQAPPPAGHDEEVVPANDRKPVVTSKETMQRSSNQIIPAASDDNQPTIGAKQETQEASIKSKDVIIGLIIAAVIMGAVFIGIKFYKDRKAAASYQGVNSTENPTEGREMQTIERAENKPLMGANAHAEDSSNGQLANNATESSENTVTPAPKRTTMEIIVNAADSDLPDIDDPNRLSTIVVSNTNLSKA